MFLGTDHDNQLMLSKNRGGYAARLSRKTTIHGPRRTTQAGKRQFISKASGFRRSVKGLEINMKGAYCVKRARQSRIIQKRFHCLAEFAFVILKMVPKAGFDR